jgi:hypothetical protein
MSCTDPPMNGPIKFQYYIQATSFIPEFISIPSSTFVIAPTLASHVGIKIIEGKACDEGNLCSVFSFKVTVINDYPVFGSLPPMNDVNLPYGVYEIFSVLGPVTDSEGHAFKANIV